MRSQPMPLSTHRDLSSPRPPLALGTLSLLGTLLLSPTLSASSLPGALPQPTPTPSAATALSADTMATADKPRGFRYSVIRGGVIDDIEPTLLYVKSRKTAKTSRAVPIPKDKSLLASCIAGGAPEALVRGTVVTVRFDPKGVVRPEIIIERRSQIEVLDGAKVIDRGGNKLYITTSEGQSRGFQIEGGAKAWESVVEGGPVSALVTGARVRVEHDPSGRQALKVILLDPPKPQPQDEGCGCNIGDTSGSSPGAGSLGLLLLFLLILRWRHRAMAREDRVNRRRA